jgi:ubiquinone/menaquinone biosynthesis C-methylase UbiE
LSESEYTGNPFDNPNLAARYEQWYAGRGRRSDRLEKRLLGELLHDFPDAGTVLEIGCGTGHFTRWIVTLGFCVVGLDSSAAMLSEVRKHNCVPYVLGDASTLPFADRSFDLATMITTLEFVPDPQHALNEMFRVTEQGVILGVLNRRSLLAFRRRMLGKPPWNTARLFSPGELARLVRQTAGERLRSLQWSTTLWPLPIRGSLPLPWGGFIGMAAKLR